MFKSSENLRLAADMSALERVAAPWRSARRTWFDGTPESLEARIAATERVLRHARSGLTAAHLALGTEAAAARTELLAARHRLMVDFLDDGARAFTGSQRVAVSWGQGEDTDPYGNDVFPGHAECRHCGEDIRESEPDTGDWHHDYESDHPAEPDDEDYGHLGSRLAAAEDEACEDCGAECGEKCRPWCTGKAKNDDEKAEKKKTSMRVAAINFLAEQNTADRQELLFRAHRHAAERTGQLPVPTAQRVVQDFVAAVSREIPRTRPAARKAAAAPVVADFDDQLLFDS